MIEKKRAKNSKPKNLHKKHKKTQKKNTSSYKDAYNA